MERTLSSEHYNTGQEGHSSMHLFPYVLILISLVFVWVPQFSQIRSHIPSRAWGPSGNVGWWRCIVCHTVFQWCLREANRGRASCLLTLVHRGFHLFALWVTYCSCSWLQLWPCSSIGGTCSAGSDDIRPWLFGWLYNDTGLPGVWVVSVHADRLVSFEWLFRWSGILVVIMSLFLLAGYELGFHGLMVSTVEKGPLARG